MKHVLIILAVIIGFGIWAASGSIGRDAARSVFKSSKPAATKKDTFVEKGLLKAAKELNKDSPKMVSDSLRFDKAVADISDRTLTYHNTFVNLSSANTDFSFLQNNLSKTISFICGEKDMKWAMSHGASYIYVYRESNGNEVAKFSVSETDCR